MVRFSEHLPGPAIYYIDIGMDILRHGKCSNTKCEAGGRVKIVDEVKRG